MSQPGTASGFTTRQVCDLVGVAPSTLNSWSRPDGLLQASILGSSGARSDRYWSVRDLVVVRTIKALRQAGCPMQQLRTAADLIDQNWDADLSEVVLYWDGQDLVALDAWGDVSSLVRHPGQYMFHLVALPLDRWRTEAEGQAREIAIEKILERRAKRAGLRRAPERTSGLGQSAADG
ncbi:MerR family transcriptional regulator [uncultured Nocardioides sp.]|uniref:MerR family transcriptional regulator n=1 Tax=uncultured Nocardioides sp. TaxID=198441 RepID=UPI0026103048|nr:MerR family transcriptional regulator [uncultured Nocardioides sp.]